MKMKIQEWMKTKLLLRTIELDIDDWLLAIFLSSVKLNFDKANNHFIFSLFKTVHDIL